MGRRNETQSFEEPILELYYVGEVSPDLREELGDTYGHQYTEKYTRPTNAAKRPILNISLLSDQSLLFGEEITVDNIEEALDT